MKKEEKQYSMTDVKPGMTVRVHETIKEINPKGEEKQRVQVFEGLVLARKGGNTAGASITVRKVTSGFGVEKIFPIHSPLIAKVEILKIARVRRAKLFFVRNKHRRLRDINEKK